MGDVLSLHIPLRARHSRADTMWMESFWWIERGSKCGQKEQKQEEKNCDTNSQSHSTLERRHDGFMESKNFIRQDKFISANDIQQN